MENHHGSATPGQVCGGSVEPQSHGGEPQLFLPSTYVPPLGFTSYTIMTNVARLRQRIALRILTSPHRARRLMPPTGRVVSLSAVVEFEAVPVMRI